jgi:hypothetical protein
MTRARSVGVPYRAGRTRTATVNEEQLARMGLLTLARELSTLALRDVTWMLYKNIAAVADRAEPFLLVPRP